MWFMWKSFYLQVENKRALRASAVIGAFMVGVLAGLLWLAVNYRGHANAGQSSSASQASTGWDEARIRQAPDQYTEHAQKTLGKTVEALQHEAGILQFRVRNKTMQVLRARQEIDHIRAVLAKHEPSATTASDETAVAAQAGDHARRGMAPLMRRELARLEAREASLKESLAGLVQSAQNARAALDQAQLWRTRLFEARVRQEAGLEPSVLIELQQDLGRWQEALDGTL